MKIKKILKYISPRYILNLKRGRCTVCGKATLFVLTDVPQTIRNHAICIWCRSCSRNRHVALHVLNEFKHRGIMRISDFRYHPELVVFNTSSSSPIAKALGKNPNVMCSEFFDDVQPGESKNGVLNQDLQRLTFADNSIDLVLSEDVFEHVPDFKLGLREVHRVLKKGGKHIFSIPFYFDRKTKELFEIRGGKKILSEPIEYHGDPVRGQIPCYTHIGYDTVDYLNEIGFDVKIELSHYTDEIEFGAFNCYTFITNKR